MIAEKMRTKTRAQDKPRQPAASAAKTSGTMLSLVGLGVLIGSLLTTSREDSAKADDPKRIDRVAAFRHWLANAPYHQLLEGVEGELNRGLVCSIQNHEFKYKDQQYEQIKILMWDQPENPRDQYILVKEMPILIRCTEDKAYLRWPSRSNSSQYRVEQLLCHFNMLGVTHTSNLRDWRSSYVLHVKKMLMEYTEIADFADEFAELIVNAIAEVYTRHENGKAKDTNQTIH